MIYLFYVLFAEMDSDLCLIPQYPDQYFSRLISDHYHRLYSVVSKVRTGQLFITRITFKY